MVNGSTAMQGEATLSGRQRVGEFVTVNGEPCDHIPFNSDSPRHTSKYENGHAYYLMHMGPYTNPRVGWIRGDRIKERARG